MRWLFWRRGHAEPAQSQVAATATDLVTFSSDLPGQLQHLALAPLGVGLCVGIGVGVVVSIVLVVGVSLI